MAGVMSERLCVSINLSSTTRRRDSEVNKETPRPRFRYLTEKERKTKVSQGKWAFSVELSFVGSNVISNNIKSLEKFVCFPLLSATFLVFFSDTDSVVAGNANYKIRFAALTPSKRRQSLFRKSFFFVICLCVQIVVILLLVFFAFHNEDERKEVNLFQ